MDGGGHVLVIKMILGKANFAGLSDWDKTKSRPHFVERS